MGKKEKKKDESVHKKRPAKKDLIYLTLLVALFALFFCTFILLNNAETRCFNKFDQAMQTIDADPCMSKCFNPIPQYMNFTTNYTIDIMEANT